MDTSYYPYAALSCASFLTFCKKVGPRLSVKYFPIYQTLSHAKQLEWNARTNSSINAIIVSAFCLYVLLYEDELSNDPVWGDSVVVKYACAVVVGYMISDGLLTVANYREVGEVCYMLHHALSIYAFYFVMTYGALSWFANYRLIAEFSTPFVNQRWFLDVMRYPRNSRLFLLNAVAMTTVFFLARIVTIPPYWFKVYSIYGSPECIRLGNLWYVLISTCVVLDSINIVWFVKLFQGLRRFLKSNTTAMGLL